MLPALVCYTPARTEVVKLINIHAAHAKVNTPGNEQQFRQFLKLFKAAVRSQNRSQLIKLINFPLQTAPQWSNDELKNTTTKPGEGLIGPKEFATYFKEIFNYQ